MRRREEGVRWVIMCGNKAMLQSVIFASVCNGGLTLFVNVVGFLLYKNHDLYLFFFISIFFFMWSSIRFTPMERAGLNLKVPSTGSAHPILLQLLGGKLIIQIAVIPIARQSHVLSDSCHERHGASVLLDLSGLLLHMDLVSILLWAECRAAAAVTVDLFYSGADVIMTHPMQHVEAGGR